MSCQKLCQCPFSLSIQLPKQAFSDAIVSEKEERTVAHSAFKCAWRKGWAIRPRKHLFQRSLSSQQKNSASNMSLGISQLIKLCRLQSVKHSQIALPPILFRRPNEQFKKILYPGEFHCRSIIFSQIKRPLRSLWNIQAVFGQDLPPKSLGYWLLD